MTKKQVGWILIGLLLVVSRLYIWQAKPTDFSQITAVYMPYAHLWAEGLKPYLEQWYEYPPATIPLFYLPHWIDLKTMTFSWHLNYGLAYRGLIFWVDMGLVGLIIVWLKKLKVKAPIIWGGLIYYALATAKAHDFIYDAMDLVFVAAVVIGITAPKLWGRAGQFIEWLGFFLATALKLINAPLLVVYAVMERSNRKKLLINLFAAGLIVWLLPLLIFRSALAVMLVYHGQRGLQVESVPAQIVLLINRFSHTENFEQKYQSITLIGPISEQVTQIFNWLLPIMVISYLIWGTRAAVKIRLSDQHQARVALTLVYFFGFMLVGKVLSTPYLLWQIPLLALYPFKSLKQQLAMTGPALIMIAISMTPIKNTNLGWIDVHLLIGWGRSVIIAYLLVASIFLVNQLKAQSK
ncbi:hypothetical protein A2W24_00820 [Microgenomates group bacterium RBG_16_45_19]|nr:MAG: hypothetical protein A2W24_00820 [Microgenomates group bacterium RBG_16_45_19]